MFRSIILCTVLGLSLGGCTASHDDLQRAIDGLELANESLKVTLKIYEQHCVLLPKSKICVGEVAARIRTALAIGPLTIDEIKKILTEVK
jgi:hypothetical protein